MKYYSAIKKKEIMSFAGKWMEIEIIVVSKISQTEKHKYHIFSHMQKLDHKKKKADMIMKGDSLGEGLTGGRRREREVKEENMIEVHCMHA
jgi:hypothetical protein